MKKTILEKQTFGLLPSGREAELFILRSDTGAEAHITTYGATLTYFKTPDRQGNMDNIVLGFPDLDGYLKHKGCFGSTVGRVANRIAGGKFTLEGKSCILDVNDNHGNSLHGGWKGFDKRLWTVNARGEAHNNGLTLSYTSEHLEEGFPGKLFVQVTYSLSNSRLQILYFAEADQTTIVNLTNHSYFNLNGAGNGNILDHELMIDADFYTPVDEKLIPTGELAPVAGTPFDFRTPQKIGARIGQVPGNFGGYDHNFVFRDPGKSKTRSRVVAFSPSSGRRLTVTTSQPGMQLYCGNHLDGTDIGHGGQRYHRYGGFCLETQHFPDAIHHKNFPSVVLRAGQTYRHWVEIDFSPP